MVKIDKECDVEMSGSVPRIASEIGTLIMCFYEQLLESQGRNAAIWAISGLFYGLMQDAASDNGAPEHFGKDVRKGIEIACMKMMDDCGEEEGVTS